MEEQKVRKNKRSFGAGFVCGLICCLFIIPAGFGVQYLYDNVLVYIYQKPVIIDATEYDSVLNERSFHKIEAIETIIEEHFYRAENITNEQLEEGLYRGLVDSLNDPYSQYFSEAELARANANIEGIFYGIGALISYDTDKELAVISGIIDGGSASESDLREGDFIVKVDDVDVTSFTSSEVVGLVRGQENTIVNLTIYRESASDYITIELVRRRVDKRTVDYGITEDENIGYIYISEFDNVTIGHFTEALSDLKELGIRGLILDLRSNPGGNINSVTAIARQILPKGLIVYTEDRQGNRTEYACDGRNELGLHLVVLVNEFTASAAEILAGAIQDHDKGTVIGQATFGKAAVQRIINMSDNTAVKLTVSTYFTPLGRDIGDTGIIPDIEIALDREAYYEDGIDNQREKAMEVLEGLIY
ncbi:MAG: S41 family peptidase [Lachnospiraceae bacterium]|nr:S41 family peptidase [Lachnospiraceae bacterium]